MAAQVAMPGNGCNSCRHKSEHGIAVRGDSLVKPRQLFVMDGGHNSASIAGGGMSGVLVVHYNK